MSFNPRSRADVISMNTWNENVTKVDQVNHISFLRKKFMKRWPHAPLIAIEDYIQKCLRPKKFYDRGRL
jgi:hypothetical protein